MVVALSQVLGCFPSSQSFQFNQLKCEWNTQIKRKLARTNGWPLGVLHFFCSNQSFAQNFPFPLCAIIVPSHEMANFGMNGKFCSFQIKIVAQW